MKIDVFSHIMPPKYNEALQKKVKKGTDWENMAHWIQTQPSLSDLDVRFRFMDRHPEVIQVLTVALPPLESSIVTPKDAVDLAMMANDEMCELVLKYPNRFIAAVACLPMNDIDAAIKEADRAITQLHCRGVQIFTNIDGEPLDSPKLRPLYERMAYHDFPMWIHPWGVGMTAANVPTTPYNWLIETSCAMVRLANSGIFEDYPDIKFITHHCGGGLVPFYEQRVRIPNLHKFYNDTAVYGSTPALMCGYAFFGADKILFGTDAPLGTSWPKRRTGYGYTLETVRSIERMEISDIDKDKIFFDNARKLLELAV
ncbi:amidohydrolase family protein [Chloroflexota bacterium]